MSWVSSQALHGWRLVASSVLLAAVAGAQEPGREPLAAEGDPALSIEVVVRGAAAAGSVEFGVPFELDVVRRWPAGEATEPWSDAALAPLVVEAGPWSRGVRDGRVVETRRFRAWAFRRGAVALRPELALVVPEGAAPRRATAALRTLLVDSALPAGDDGSAERPPAPALRITPVWRELGRLLALAAAAGAVTWLLALGARLLRRRRTAVPSGSRTELLARVEELARTAADTRALQCAAAVQATAILRAAERLGAPGDEVQRAAESALQVVEAVKFAGRVLAPGERDALVAQLRRVAAAVPEEVAR